MGIIVALRRKRPCGEMDITTAFEAVGGGSIPSEGTSTETKKLFGELNPEASRKAF